MATSLPPHTLMARAGLAVARLCLALAPHAQKIWIACGPGNNGGDGFEAAIHLHKWGKAVLLTWTGLPPGKSALPPDAHAARKRAIAAGVPMAAEAPQDFDVCIDALLGIGARPGPARESSTLLVSWLGQMQRSRALYLAVDVPTGLDADTGKASDLDATDLIADAAHNDWAGHGFDTKIRRQRVTLSLLTLKPGLFTADGRDQAGEVWFDDLGCHPQHCAAPPPVAARLLVDSAAEAGARAAGLHASHKGSFGDVAIVGGQWSATSQMAGAALLAGRAALHAGAGRVFIALLGDGSPGQPGLDLAQPELMFRGVDALDLALQVVVCGCGGGQAVSAVLPGLIEGATRLVLDADALNAVAADARLRDLLARRQSRGQQTVLTPHPLEAARLAGLSTAEVQANRLHLAERLAEQFQSVVVLKGSGSVIAAPGQISCINSSGNPLLATAGTGDVLAGMVGAQLASGLGAFDAACAAVFEHGQLADEWAATRPGEPLTSSRLAMGRQRRY